MASSTLTQEWDKHPMSITVTQRNSAFKIWQIQTERTINNLLMKINWGFNFTLEEMSCRLSRFLLKSLAWKSNIKKERFEQCANFAEKTTED